jgi:tetratricopeptide (TPR) repeat protein
MMAAAPDGGRAGSGGQHDGQGGSGASRGGRGHRGEGRRDAARGERSGGRGTGSKASGRQGGRGATSRDRDADGDGQERIGAAREPIGRDRAIRSAGAPPRPARREQRPPRPDLPTDEQPQLPRGVVKEIERALGRGGRADDVALALSIGSAAIDEGRPDVAIEVLAWAKSEASRIATIREAYGIALYHADRFADAASELQAYRRMSGRQDQNHVLADCLRALGRDLDRIAETAGALVADERAPMERRAEAAIVWAAAVADGGDLGAARAVLRRFLEGYELGEAEHDLRLMYLLGDLAQRAGDTDDARRHFERLSAIDPELLDVGERLEAL